jgi:hypothetical protein
MARKKQKKNSVGITKTKKKEIDREKEKYN